MSTIKEILQVFGGPHSVAQYERECRESAAANWDLGYDAHKRGEQRHNPYRTLAVVRNDDPEDAALQELMSNILTDHGVPERCTDPSCPAARTPHHHGSRIGYRNEPSVRHTPVCMCARAAMGSTRCDACSHDLSCPCECSNLLRQGNKA